MFPHGGPMKRKLNYKIFALSLSLILGLSACGDQKIPVTNNDVIIEQSKFPEESEAVTTAAPTETPKMETQESSPENTVDTSSDWYQQMLDASILSTGNNGRLEKVIAKIKSGENVSISLIGGSITEGAGAENFSYSYGEQFILALQDIYPDSAIQYYNAGLGSTGSALGMMRYERDVIDVVGTSPDLVIVEFTVNDEDDPTAGRAYESLVHTILESENEPAVILLHSVFQNTWNMQELYSPIGELYELPMVSIKDATQPAYASGNLTDELFFSDIYHPTSFGHKIMADCLVELFDRVASQDSSQEITPLPADSVNSLDFMNMHLITSADSAGADIAPGSFNEQDAEIQNFSRTATSAFPDNWMHQADSGTESFKAELTCKNIMITYKLSSSPEFGDASVYIDGEFVTELYPYEEGSWNNTMTELVLDEKEAAPHTLEIVMSEGFEDGLFTILGIGYTD